MTDYQLLTTHIQYFCARDSDGNQVAPDDVSFRLEDPSHTVTYPEVVQVEQASLAGASAALGEELSSTTGVYQVEITPDAAGTWHFQWQTTTPTIGLYDFFQVPWPSFEVSAS